MAHINLGILYSDHFKWNDAINAYKSAINISPIPLSATHFGIGFAYHQINRHEDAEKEFIKAISIDPSIVKAHYYLALTYLSLGKREETYGEYKLINELDKKLANDILNRIYK